MPAERFPVPDGQVDLKALLDHLAPAGYTPEERAKALVEQAPAIRRAALAAAETSPDRARVLADSLQTGDGEPAFLPFTEGIETTPPELRAEAGRAAASIATAVVPAFVQLERHPSSDTKIGAVQFLARRKEDQ